MRAPLEMIERIESYIGGTMNTAETAAFQAELINSNDLQKLVENQQLIQQAIARKAILSQVQQFAPVPSTRFSNWSVIRWVIIGVILIGSLISYAFLKSENTEGQSENNTVQEQTSASGKVPPPTKQSTLAAAAAPSSFGHSNIVHPFKVSDEKNATDTQALEGLNTWVKPTRQFFHIVPQVSNTLECEGGTLIIIPSNSIIDKNGKVADREVTLEVVEALTMDKMIAYNLTTMADGKALSSGGMLYVQPYQNSEKLNFTKERPIHIEVPTNEYNGDMVAWKGEVNEKGDINWVDPTPLQKFLVPVDFTTLDHTPERYRQAFRSQLPFENYTVSSTELEDSFYYSLGATDISSSNQNEVAIKIGDGKDAQIIMPEEFSQNSINSFNLQLYGLSQEQQKNTTITFSYLKGIKTTATLNEDGFFSFNIMMEGNTVDASAIIKVGDCEPIRTPNLKYRIGAVIPFEVTPTECMNKIKDKPTHCFIDPSSIQAIRLPKFAKTYLATKEFEQRLKELHKIPNAQEYFDLYVANLSKNLFETDNQIAAKLSGPQKQVFQNFAQEGLTNVDLTNVHLKDLQDYYNDKRKDFKVEARAEQSKLEKKTQSELAALSKEMNDLVVNYNMFLATSSHSKSDTVPIKRRRISSRNSVATTGSYKLSWYQPGWVNIDCYLHVLTQGESLVNIKTNGLQPGQTVYQCINSLKTIVPLTMDAERYVAHYPSQNNPASVDFVKSYSVGLSRNGKEGIRYAEASFNPYQGNDIQLNWEEVSEDELIHRLKKLSPNNDPLVKDIEDQRERIRKAQEFNQDRAEIQSRRQLILDKQARRDEFISGLIKSINPCQEVRSIGKKIVEQTPDVINLK